MDHQAFAQILGNYGEFIGAIAVVVTLAYLAVQVRQNTRSMKSQYDLQVVDSLQTITDADTQRLMLRAQDPNLMQLWLDGLAGKPMSEVDLHRFRSMCSSEIWQGAISNQRNIALGRNRLMQAEYEEFRRKINSSVGFKACWEANLPGLRRWGMDSLIESRSLESTGLCAIAFLPLLPFSYINIFKILRILCFCKTNDSRLTSGIRY